MTKNLTKSRLYCVLISLFIDFGAKIQIQVKILVSRSFLTKSNFFTKSTFTFTKLGLYCTILGAKIQMILVVNQT